MTGTGRPRYGLSGYRYRPRIRAMAVGGREYIEAYARRLDPVADGDMGAGLPSTTAWTWGVARLNHGIGSGRSRRRCAGNANSPRIAFGRNTPLRGGNSTT
jgi:hypothetical protein